MFVDVREIEAHCVGIILVLNQAAHTFIPAL
jgi:hypothetical protein